MKGLGLFFVAIALIVGGWGILVIVLGGSMGGIEYVAAIVGFILGVIGLVCNAAAKPDPKAIEKQQVRSGTAKKCPFCAETIKAEAKVCRFCGRDLNSSQSSAAPTSTASRQPLTTAAQPHRTTVAPKLSYAPPAPEPIENSCLFLWLHDEQSGPYTAKQTQTMLAQNSIEAETLVWEEGMDGWSPLTDTSVLGNKHQKIAFACPRCQERLEATGNQSGTSLNCPVCQHRVTIPQFALSEAAASHTHTQLTKPLGKQAIYALGVLATFLVSIAILMAHSGAKNQAKIESARKADNEKQAQGKEKKRLLTQALLENYPNVESYIASIKEGTQTIGSACYDLKFTFEHARSMTNDMVTRDIQSANDKIEKGRALLRANPPACLAQEMSEKISKLNDSASSLSTFINATNNATSHHDLEVSAHYVVDERASVEKLVNDLSSYLSRDVLDLASADVKDRLANAHPSSASSIDSSTGTLVSSERLSSPAPLLDYKTIAPEQLSILANQGDKEAQHWLGSHYLHGDGVEKDIPKGFALFTQSAAQGSAIGSRKKGVCYENGLGTEKDFNIARGCYEYALANGDNMAAYCLGQMYMNGKGVGVDYVKAKELLQVAKDKNIVDAIIPLAWLYDNGKGVVEDDAKALSLYNEALEKGVADANYYIGLRYHAGNGVPQDDVIAIEYLKKAGNTQQGRAMMTLSSMYATGEKNVPSNLPEALSWAKLAKEAGNGDADQFIQNITILIALKNNSTQVATNYVQAQTALVSSASGAVARSQLAAVMAFPELGVKGSPLNLRYMQLYEARKQDSLKFFSMTKTGL